MNKNDFNIKEHSWLARIAAWKLGSSSVAIVLGKTIHLHNVSCEQFLSNDSWVKHELCHIEQFRQYGYLNFIIKYLLETIRKGYYNNKYEVAARAAEKL